MIDLDTKLNGIARKHGIEPKPNVTPTPVHATLCIACSNGPSLVNDLCEPCYRRAHLTPLLQLQDKLYKQISDVLINVARHEAQLKDAKVKYNKAERQNHRCLKCKKIFAYFGDLHLHEQEKACERPRTAAKVVKRSRIREEDIA